MTAIDLVVTDLDGTLWDAGERIHERTLTALRTLESLGTPLLVATGRRRSSAAVALAREQLRPPAVLLGGALGADLATGREFHREAFVPEDAASALEVFLDHGLEPCVYVADGEVEVLVGDAPATHPEHLRRLAGSARKVDLRRAAREEAVLSFGLIGGDPAALLAVAADLGRAQAIVNRDLYFGSVTLMVAPPDVTKWAGVLAYCERHAIDPGRVLAIGDGANDLDLLAAASVACVVEDACAEALALADHVVPPASEGGWADILPLL